MKHILSDGRELMAAYDDINEFFKRNKVVGRKIIDIRPAALDYIIRNMYDIDNIISCETESAIDTDGQVCLIFDNGETLEVQFSGEGPIILGFNTAVLSDYPKYDGSCYKLSTLFKHAIGGEIAKVVFAKSNSKMVFPKYYGIDMSEDDDGVTEIAFVLQDGSSVVVGGSIDWFTLEHRSNNGQCKSVPYKELLQELSQETIVDIFEDEAESIISQL